MHIERVQIEEGFLDGLDVSFVRGLNVIIGERGSLIELIRFCLGVQGYSTFPIVEREETDHHGRYLSRDLCLAWMSAMAAGDPDADIRL